MIKYLILGIYAIIAIVIIFLLIFLLVRNFAWGFISPRTKHISILVGLIIAGLIAAGFLALLMTDL